LDKRGVDDTNLRARFLRLDNALGVGIEIVTGLKMELSSRMKRALA
jgi:hypothetical protein